MAKAFDPLSERTIHEGWMWKQGSVKKIWRKRYFILSQECLSYWDSIPPRNNNNSSSLAANSSSSSSSSSSGTTSSQLTTSGGSNSASQSNTAAPMPRGLIPLENCEIEEEADKTTGYRFSFIIFTALDRDYTLRCTAEDEVLEWLVAIKRAVLMANKKKRKEKKEKHRPWYHNLLLRNKKTHSKAITATKAVEVVEAPPQEEEHYIQIFGAPLEEVLRRDGVEYKIPYIMRQIIDYIETNALEIQGIFRLSGDNEDIQWLTTRFERGEEVDLFKVRDPHSVTGLLKKYIRELPDPIGTFNLYPEWLAAAQCPSEREVIAECRRLVQCLPKANMEVLKRLMQLLAEVSQFASINNMNTKNLAIVFAPNLFRGRDVSTMQSLKDTPFIMSVTKTLIEHLNDIFPSDSGVHISRAMSVVQLSLSSRAVLEQMQEEEEEDEDDLTESHGTAPESYDPAASATDTTSYDALYQLELEVSAFIHSLGESEEVGVGALIDTQKLCTDVEQTDKQHAVLLQEIDTFLLELNSSVS